MVGHQGLGMVAFKRKQWRDAENHFRAALRLDPENAALLNNLGMALSRQGRDREAVSYFADSSRADPSDDTARRNATVTAMAAGVGLLIFTLLRPVLTSQAKGVSGWWVVPVSLLMIAASAAYFGVLLVRRLRSKDPRASRQTMATLRRQWWLDRRSRRG
jgi:tetratricopeptide (TPR) repeat protein